MLITVYTMFTPITTSQALRLQNTNMLLSTRGTSMILHASLLLC